MSLPTPEDGNRDSFRNIVFSNFCGIPDEEQNKRKSERYTRSSEAFRIYNVTFFDVWGRVFDENVAYQNRMDCCTGTDCEEKRFKFCGKETDDAAL
jgi:hypothetical protein